METVYKILFKLISKRAFNIIPSPGTYVYKLMCYKSFLYIIKFFKNILNVSSLTKNKLSDIYKLIQNFDSIIQYFISMKY